MLFFKFLNLWIFEDVWSRDVKTERESEKIINLLEIAFASAVKIDEPSGIHMFSE